MRITLGTLLVTLALSACAGVTPGSPPAPKSSSATAPPPPTRPAPPPGWVDTRIPGSRVAVYLPPGFVRVAHMPAFASTDGKIAVTLSDMSADSDRDLDDMLKGMLEGIGEKGLAVQQRRKMPDGTEVVRARKDEEGVSLFILAYAKGKALGMAAIQIKDPGDEARAEAILASMTFDPSKKLDTRAILGVTCDDVEGLEVNEFMSFGVAYWERGVRPPVPHGSPSLTIFFLSYAAGREMAEQALRQLMFKALHEHDVPRNEAAPKPIRANGHEGFEVVATGKKMGTPVALYLAAIDDDLGVFWVTATVATEQGGIFVDRFRQIAHSLKSADGGR